MSPSGLPPPSPRDALSLPSISGFASRTHGSQTNGSERLRYFAIRVLGTIRREIGRGTGKPLTSVSAGRILAIVVGLEGPFG